MKSIYFLIPALIAIIASIGLSVNNRTTLKETRVERIKNNDLIVGVLNEIKQEDDPALIASYEALYAQEVRLAESKANTDTHNVNIKRLDNEISGLNSEKAPVDSISINDLSLESVCFILSNTDLVSSIAYNCLLANR